MTWDGRNLPYPRESFHVVVALFAPASPPDLVEFLADMQRVVRPGGDMHFVDAGSRLGGGVHAFKPELIETLTRAGFQETRSGSDERSPSTGHAPGRPVRAWHKSAR